MSWDLLAWVRVRSGEVPLRFVVVGDHDEADDAPDYDSDRDYNTGYGEDYTSSGEALFAWWLLS